MELASITNCMQLLASFYYLRGVKVFSTLVRMIIEMAKGIGAFVVIMILAIVNFTVAWRLGATVTTLGWVSPVPAVPVFFR